MVSNCSLSLSLSYINNTHKPSLVSYSQCWIGTVSSIFSEISNLSYFCNYSWQQKKYWYSTNSNLQLMPSQTRSPESLHSRIHAFVILPFIFNSERSRMLWTLPCNFLMMRFWDFISTLLLHSASSIKHPSLVLCCQNTYLFDTCTFQIQNVDTIPFCIIFSNTLHYAVYTCTIGSCMPSCAFSGLMSPWYRWDYTLVATPVSM